jgi:hypothetical protein
MSMSSEPENLALVINKPLANDLWRLLEDSLKNGVN